MRRTTCLLLGAVLMLQVLPALAASPPSAARLEKLARQVAAVGVGMDGYVLGRPLTRAQQDLARRNRLDGPYPGTIKFRDGELTVVAAEGTPVVLAVYQRLEEADRARLRRMIASLMDRFGEPTTMAHDRMIYWAYDGSGKISEERFNQARDKGRIAVLATVKLQSELPIVAPAESQEKGRDSQPEKKAVVYFLLTSNPLNGLFVQR